MTDPISAAHDALDRLKRACDRGTGCHLTADMIHGLSVTMVGQMWDEERPAALTQEPLSGDTSKKEG